MISILLALMLLIELHARCSCYVSLCILVISWLPLLPFWVFSLKVGGWVGTPGGCARARARARITILRHVSRLHLFRGRIHLRRFRPRLLRRIGLRRRGLASGIGGSPRSLSIQRAGSAGNGMISSILGQLEGGRTLESQNTSFHFISATNPCDARLQTQMQMNKNAGFRMQNLYSEPNVFVFGT